MSERAPGGAGRQVCWSASGAWLAAATPGGVTLRELRSGARRDVALPVSALGFVDERLLVVSGAAVHTLAIGEASAATGGARPLALADDEQASFCAAGAAAALVISTPTHHRLASGQARACFERRDPQDTLAAVLPQHGAVLVGKSGAVLVEAGGARVALPISGASAGASAGSILRVDLLFGGRAVAVLASEGDAAVCSVISRAGEVIRRISLPRPAGWSVAGNSALALVLDEAGVLRAIDLRVGCVAWACTPSPSWSALALDPGGTTLALLPQGSDELEVLSVSALAEAALASRPPKRAPVHELAGAVGEVPSPPSPSPSPPSLSLSSPSPSPSSPPSLSPASSSPSPPSLSLSSPSPSSSPPSPPSSPSPSSLPPLTLGSTAWLARRRHRRLPVPGVAPYEHAAAHLEAVLALCRARVHLAIANEWSQGRLAFRGNEALPFQSEVAVLARGSSPASSPSPATAEIQRQVATLYAELVRRTSATVAHGRALPLVELADEHGLDPAEVHVLLAVAAPALCPDITRLYLIATNNPARSCDRALVRTLLGAELGEARLARILAPAAPLLRLGLVELHPASNWQFDALTVRPALLLRLLGEPVAAVAGDAVTVRPAALELERFRGRRDELQRWLSALEASPPGRRDVRLIVQGPAASGRRTLLDAVAARAQRRCGFIDAGPLAALGGGALAALRGAIRDAVIAGCVPCVVDPEALMTDAATTMALRELLRMHPGPLAIVARPGAPTPVEAGALSVTLPAATATERLAAWSDAAARFGLVAQELSTVATRLPAGMATIEHVCRETAAALAGSERDCSVDLDARCRQQLEHKLGKLATRVVRKASRDELILPRELREAIDELIAGVRLRHVVYDGWGFGHSSSLRGLTALFYGPPGTGKSMVAGMIASELGLELYRVDLSAVTSKWLGETEKHLAELFDAAEGGELVLLFDEADALFAKRTEVESSHDRYANLGTSYLLQRLDDFAGIALLTSNSESSIDEAFKRRLSFRLQFQFPEADMRAKLWAAHLPADVPRAADIDFGELADRFQLSGGNIRNCLLRAAFLAAREGAPLDQGRLLRTVESEYREMGHISTTGRLI